MCSWVFCALSLWCTLPDLSKREKPSDENELMFLTAQGKGMGPKFSSSWLLRIEENSSNWWIEWNVFQASRIVYLIHWVSHKNFKRRARFGERAEDGRGGSKVGKAGEKEREDWASHQGRPTRRKAREGMGEAKESKSEAEGPWEERGRTQRRGGHGDQKQQGRTKETYFSTHWLTTGWLWANDYVSVRQDNSLPHQLCVSKRGMGVTVL